MPRVGRCRSEPLSNWPSVDREAWLFAQKPVSPFSSRRLRRRWTAITWQGVERAYGYWLSWLAQTRQIEEVNCPASRASRERLESYMEHMQALGLADLTVSGNLAGVGRALLVMAPDVDTSWIELGASRLAAVAGRARDVRKIVRPAANLVDLGFALMAAEEGDDLKGGSYVSLRFRDGLLIAFLMHCPLRRRNLTALELGAHVFKEEGVWRLEVPADQTKTGQAIRCQWPPALVESLETYLAIHRPALLRCGRHDEHTDKLWVTRHGGPASAAAIYQAVRERTAAAFGTAIYPHAFRHIAATDLATNAPERTTAIKDVLGHSTMDPSTRFYNQAETDGAVALMQATFEAERNSPV